MIPKMRIGGKKKKQAFESDLIKVIHAVYACDLVFAAVHSSFFFVLKYKPGLVKKPSGLISLQ